MARLDRLPLLMLTTLVRWLLCLVLAVALGALTTIALVYGPARWSNATMTLTGAVAGPEASWNMTLAKGFGVERCHLTRGHVIMLGPPGAAAALPAWLELPAGEGNRWIMGIEAIAAGWPFVCARATTTFDVLNLNPLAREWDGGMVLDAGATFQPFTASVIPHEPIWRGVWSNLAVWSGAWLALLLLCRTGRVLQRRLRNRCVRCGYSLHGSFGERCPECGALLPARKGSREAVSSPVTEDRP